jgi:Mrp family chromosome partitioning ATPase
MDRVRKALDLARLERSQTANPPPAEPAAVHAGAGEADASSGAGFMAAPAANAPPTANAPPAANAPPTGIAYACTRVFTPSSDVLERNRIFSPASASPAAAAFRMLRTQVLQRMDANGWRTLAIFSPAADDGKTTTAINLAAALANDRRHTVLLVEFDFKRPALATRLGLSPQFGSDDALAGGASVQDCLYHPDGFDRLVLMPARGLLEHSSELLAGHRSREIVSELRGRYPERIVLFDLPPVLAADDALSFAPLVECGLVVASEGHTRRKDLVRTVELLHNTPLVGTVLNRAADAPAGH